jgi:hypothetical protein
VEEEKEEEEEEEEEEARGCSAWGRQPRAKRGVPAVSGMGSEPQLEGSLCSCSCMTHTKEELLLLLAACRNRWLGAHSTAAASVKPAFITPSSALCSLP